MASGALHPAAEIALATGALSSKWYVLFPNANLGDFKVVSAITCLLAQRTVDNLELENVN
jgi:hypothetical protein